jgi:flagellar biogenesis protein FliO
MEPYLAIKLIIALVFIVFFAFMLKDTMRRPGPGDGGGGD